MFHALVKISLTLTHQARHFSGLPHSKLIPSNSKQILDPREQSLCRTLLGHSRFLGTRCEPVKCYVPMFCSFSEGVDRCVVISVTECVKNDRVRQGCCGSVRELRLSEGNRSPLVFLLWAPGFAELDCTHTQGYCMTQLRGWFDGLEKR